MPVHHGLRRPPSCWDRSAGGFPQCLQLACRALRPEHPSCSRRRAPCGRRPPPGLPGTERSTQAVGCSAQQGGGQAAAEAQRCAASEGEAPRLRAGVTQPGRRRRRLMYVQLPSGTLLCLSEDRSALARPPAERSLAGRSGSLRRAWFSGGSAGRLTRAAQSGWPAGGCCRFANGSLGHGRVGPGVREAVR